MKNRTKTLLSAAICLVFGAICILSTLLIEWQVRHSQQPQPAPTFTSSQLYERAVKDAMVAQQSEILPLLTVNTQEKNITWNASNNQVLMARWHRHYEGTCYCQVSSYTTNSEMFVFSITELINWAKSQEKIEDYTLRLEQLIGLPPENGYVEFSTFWVNPSDLWRPAYNEDVTNSAMTLSLKENADAQFTSWFNDNILGSYYSEWLYPWTRLGYTYDWADNGTEYGLTEFIVKKECTVQIEDSYKNDAFYEMLFA